MPTQLDLPPANTVCLYEVGPFRLYADCELVSMSSRRTPGTGGKIDLWKNNDGTRRNWRQDDGPRVMGSRRESASGGGAGTSAMTARPGLSDSAPRRRP